MNKTYEIIKLGNPSLRKISTPIPQNEFGSSKLKDLTERLFAIMKIENGLGLAAPQIGINERAIVFGMDAHPSRTHLSAIPFTILFNPTFEPTSDVCIEDYEGCISVGNLRGKVSRYQSICYKGYDVDGNLIEREVSDLHARVLQHEIDHLDGIIFLDKISDLNSLGFHEELIKHNLLT